MTHDRRLSRIRRHHATAQLDLIGLARCAVCLCSRTVHDQPDSRAPGRCRACVACRRYQPRSAW